MEHLSLIVTLSAQHSVSEEKIFKLFSDLIFYVIAS